MPQSQSSLPAIRRSLLRWYARHARDLPWRRTHDPYSIWVSEIMLQQTQVATVIDYFHRFLEAFPNVHALAAAEEQTVLGLWAGLGYYRRARQMHAAAKKIVADFGCFPVQFDDILSLPGIGRYTACAIASFAFDLRAPIVEANTQRLFARLLKLEEDPRTSASQQRLWEFAEALLPASGKTGSGAINQAAMELGSQVCTPRDPNCDACPIQKYCPTFEAGLQTAIPRAAPKMVVTELTHIALVIRRSGDLLLRQNTAEQWWQGLWDFPRLDITGSLVKAHTFAKHGVTAVDREWLGAEMHRQHGLSGSVEGYLSSLKHAVTRYRITLHALAAQLATGKKPTAKLPEQSSVDSTGYQWFSPKQLADLPLTAPATKMIRQLASS